MPSTAIARAASTPRSRRWGPREAADRVSGMLVAGRPLTAPLLTDPRSMSASVAWRGPKPRLVRSSLKSEAGETQGKASVLRCLRLALASDPRRAAPSSRATALGQHPPQVSSGDYEPPEVFVDALALLLERVEHLAESLPLIVHAQSFSRPCRYPHAAKAIISELGSLNSTKRAAVRKLRLLYAVVATGF